MGDLTSFFTLCRTVAVDHGGLIGGLFLTGLLGSLTHCSGMCGPFVLSQTAARLEQIPLEHMSEWQRLKGAVLLPYHLGRATTYAALGAMAAFTAGRFSQWEGFKPLAAGLLILAALFLLSLALPRLKRGGEESWWSNTVAGWARPLFASPTGWRGWTLGLALGFIPCGLLYAAVAAAASSGDPLAGAMGMLAFSAGTVPLLVGVGVVGHFAMTRWRQSVQRWAPVLLVINAGMLVAMAVSLLRP